jgi:hypothetical protein
MDIGSFHEYLLSAGLPVESIRNTNGTVDGIEIVFSVDVSTAIEDEAAAAKRKFDFGPKPDEREQVLSALISAAKGKSIDQLKAALSEKEEAAANNKELQS